MPMRCTGIDWPCSASSALDDHKSVVLTMILAVNGARPEAVKKESMSSRRRTCVGA